MRTLVVDCSRGASGDRLLAALLGLGADRQAFLDALGSLGLSDLFELDIQPQEQEGVSGLRVQFSETPATTPNSEDNRRAQVARPGYGLEHDHDWDAGGAAAQEVSPVFGHLHEHSGMDPDFPQSDNHFGGIHDHDYNELFTAGAAHQTAAQVRFTEAIARLGKSRLSPGAQTVVSKGLDYLMDLAAQSIGASRQEALLEESCPLDTLVYLTGCGICLDALAPQRVLVNAGPMDACTQAFFSGSDASFESANDLRAEKTACGYGVPSQGKVHFLRVLLGDMACV